MRKIALFLTLLLPLLCCAEVEYHCGQLVWLPAGSTELTSCGYLITEDDPAINPLTPNYCAFIDYPDKAPEVFLMSYHVDVQTGVATVIYNGRGPLFGKSGTWEEIISTATGVDDPSQVVSVTDSQIYEDRVYIAELLYLDEESPDNLIGSFRTVLYRIPEVIPGLH